MDSSEAFSFLVGGEGRERGERKGEKGKERKEEGRRKRREEGREREGGKKGEAITMLKTHSLVTNSSTCQLYVLPDRHALLRTRGRSS